MSDPVTERIRGIVVRYLDGQQSLDAAATDYARVWKDWMRQGQLGRPATLDDLLVDRPNVDVLRAGDDLRPGLTDQDFPRLLELMELVDRKMSEGDEGAA